jgi:sirohydrochlorin cobaltochelatase
VTDAPSSSTVVGARTLLLVGHGSAHDPAASAPIRKTARRLRRLGGFDHVHCAFWKEPPFMKDALARVRGGHVFIVPMFLADGYYTRVVVPRELGLEQSCTRRGARIIHCCSPVGVHPAMAKLALRKAHRVAPLTTTARRETALILIGHGTERHDCSALSTQRVTDSLQASGFRTVKCGFLDQEPRIESVLEQTTEREIILVPYFLAAGWHTRVTIPQRLGLNGAHTVANGRTLWYAAPVGLSSGIAFIARDLVRRVSV